MKYEAKQSSSTVPTSTASGTPWTSISQANAITYSQNVAGCTGCHLITEAEWMTIAQNVLSVGSNWSSGTVGSGYIYSGHNDNLPAIPLTASSNDSNGYYGENNTTGNQRRTLALNNGEVIWDMAGNIREWTSGQASIGQPGVLGGGFAWREWNEVTTHGTLSPDPFPNYGTPAASGWNSTNGIGKIYSNADNSATTYCFNRGGGWDNNASSGILTLTMNSTVGGVSAGIGFRVAYPASSSQSLVVSENGRYPSTYINTSLDTMTAILTELDTKAITAPNVDDATSTFKAATNNTQSASGVTPQPTVDQYVYQPLTSSGALCTSEAQICTKFNLYYRLEEDNTVYMVTSKNQ